MDKKAGDRQAAENLSEIENLRAAAKRVRNALDELDTAGIYVDHTGVDWLSEAMTERRGQIGTFMEEIETQIAEMAETFEGHACSVTVYEPEGHVHSYGNYVFEVEERQRNQRHTYMVTVDEDDGAGMITSALAKGTVSMESGERINPDNFGSSSAVGWNNAVHAVVEAGKFECAEDDPVDLLEMPEV